MNPLLALLGEAYKVKFVSGETLEICKSMDEAIRLCIQEGVIKYKQSTLADLLEIDNGQLSKILNGKKYNFPPDKLAELMKVCGNYAPLQYLLKQLGFKDEVLPLLEKLAA